EGGAEPLLVQPEGVALDRAGHIYVADRARGAVVRLEADGRVADPRWLAVMRPRLLAIDEHDVVWVGADGPAEAPWQRGPGEIWRVAPGADPRLLLSGPVASSIAAGPGGRLYVADRQGGRIFVLDAEGRRTDFATFTDSDAPRALAFVPVTERTRRAGIAGDLLVVTIRRGAWPVNEVVRITGPFDTLEPR
ncbi:MAG TPA: PQQ-binding-like beta-propeller repeat protein, partial [Candidatus Tectomicrobia bacterium]|nr:PQQ-binding-like beta-propeller repeat protein [Candidatus Tectomicrobia bacterium]